jgi:O-antigen/teichoic acid export membrane protein
VLVTIAVSLWLVVSLRMEALGAILGGLAGQIVCTALAFGFASGKPLVGGLGSYARELLAHGLPMVPSFFLLFVLQYGVRWPLEWYHGLDVVGVYSVGASVGASLGVFTAAFASAWTPFALGHTDRQHAASQVFGRVTLYYVAGFGFATSLLFLFAEPLVRLLAQPPFHAGAAAVGLSAAGQFFLTLFLLLLPPLYFAKRVQNVVLTQSAAALVACVLAVWLVPRHGVAGAAATVALAAFALVVIQWTALRALPVLQVRYDYLRAGLLLLIFSAASWVSFELQFTDVLLGLAQATAVAIAAAIAAGLVCLDFRRSSAWTSGS